jgi:hypothetical protein
MHIINKFLSFLKHHITNRRKTMEQPRGLLAALRKALEDFINDDSINVIQKLEELQEFEDEVTDQICELEEQVDGGGEGNDEEKD